MHGMMLHPIMANTCLHPILAFSLALYMPAGFLLYFNNCKNVKHFFFFNIKIDAESNIGTNLSAFNTCIQCHFLHSLVLS